MKKLVIALVCVGLLVALTIPTIYSASKWGTYTLTLSEDVEAVLEHCKASRRCISSGYIPDLRLWLDPETFGEEEYGGDYDAEGIVLSENKEGEITMQFFFFLDPGTHKKKVVLEVEGGDVTTGEWLSPSFTIKFEEAYAVITPATKEKKKILWRSENVNITIRCEEE